PLTLSLLLLPPPPRSTLFPYTTLFRSAAHCPPPNASLLGSSGPASSSVVKRGSAVSRRYPSRPRIPLLSTQRVTSTRSATSSPTAADFTWSGVAFGPMGGGLLGLVRSKLQAPTASALISVSAAMAFLILGLPIACA